MSKRMKNQASGNKALARKLAAHIKTQVDAGKLPKVGTLTAVAKDLQAMARARGIQDKLEMATISNWLPRKDNGEDKRGIPAGMVEVVRDWMNGSVRPERAHSGQLDANTMIIDKLDCIIHLLENTLTALSASVQTIIDKARQEQHNSNFRKAVKGIDTEKL